MQKRDDAMHLSRKHRRVRTGSSSISLGCRVVRLETEEEKPIGTEFFQCTPILILPLDGRAILCYRRSDSDADRRKSK